MEMQTTATYDSAQDEFVIDTPTTLAQKYWITNSAVHAKWAVVFAQLLIGGRNEGIHGFLVRIRSEVRLQREPALLLLHVLAMHDNYYWPMPRLR